MYNSHDLETEKNSIKVEHNLHSLIRTTLDGCTDTKSFRGERNAGKFIFRSIKPEIRLKSEKWHPWS